MPRSPKVDWSTAVLIEAKAPIETGVPAARPARLVIAKGQPPRVDLRGRSRLARVLAGATLRAKSLGVVHTHGQIRQFVLHEAEAVGYGMDLLLAVLVPEEGRWIQRVASVIGQWSQAREDGRKRNKRFHWELEMLRV